MIIRFFDILISCTLIILFFWVIAAVMFASIFSLGLPVIFTQIRAGKNGTPFKIFKIRTMKPLKENREIAQAHLETDRITKTGHFLRNTNLDEVPQIFNVLFGSMSMVGPRPHELSQDSHFETLIPKYPIRRKIKPGILGLAQIRGYTGPLIKTVDLQNRVECDVELVNNYNLKLYFYILFASFFIVLKRMSGIR